MGTVYKKTFTKAIPTGAEITRRSRRGTVERVARWKDAKGRLRTAIVTTGRDGADRLLIEASTYTAKYRDGRGMVREIATGCRDETAARSVLGDLERRAELVKSGVLTVTENSIADQQDKPLAVQIAAYRDHQSAKCLNSRRLSNTKARLAKLFEECSFSRLNDLSVAAFERWLAQQAVVGMSAGTRNEYRQEIVGFCNWCVRTNRLASNPFSAVAKADAKSDCRRKRRAMTEEELTTLLYVARWRPLAERGRLSIKRAAEDCTGKRGTWNAAPLTLDDLDAAVDRARKRLAKNPTLIDQLDWQGRERALVYKTLLLTGLRRGELASLTVGQVMLDGPQPYVELEARDEKNREGSQLALRADLAADLAAWIKDRSERTSGPAGAGNGAICLPMTPRALAAAPKLPNGARLFNVPDKLVNVLNRDLAAAGIAKRDDRGRTIDVHALRHSYGTMLAKSGVAPRVAMAAMRHSSIDLTMNVYTDPRLLDVHAAVELLPSLPLVAGPKTEPLAAKATGTEDSRRSALAPTLAPTADKWVQKPSFAVKTADGRSASDRRQGVIASALPVNEKSPLAITVKGYSQEPAVGVEPTTPALRMRCSAN